MQNISKEDYLSAIFKYSDQDGKIKPGLIAEKLSVSNAAVTDMLRKLSAEKYVRYERYKSISLTAAGANYAMNMVRRHRIWEVFLHRVVGMPWEKIHHEAHSLEHSGSDELINIMEKMLKFPEFDPHGEPIPSSKGKMPIIKGQKPLSELKEGESGKVVRVIDSNENFLSYISKIDIKLKRNIRVMEKIEFDGSLEINVKGKRLIISREIAANIFIEVN